VLVTGKAAPLRIKKAQKQNGVKKLGVRCLARDGVRQRTGRKSERGGEDEGGAGGLTQEVETC